MHVLFLHLRCGCCIVFLTYLTIRLFLWCGPQKCSYGKHVLYKHFALFSTCQHVILLSSAFFFFSAFVCFLEWSFLAPPLALLAPAVFSSALVVCVGLWSVPFWCGLFECPCFPVPVRCIDLLVYIEDSKLGAPQI